MTEKLILEPFENALKSLEFALSSYNADGEEFTRDACVKRFEYTYELSHKMLKRHLELTTANPSEIDTLSFQGLIRLGYEKEILKNSWDKWKIYRENRNSTSHGYKEETAIAIVNGLDIFIEEAQYLLDKLKQHHEN